MISWQFWLISTCLVASRFLLAHASSDGLDDFRKMTAGVRKKCIAETKTTIDVVQDTEYGEFPEDDRLKCYFKCALEKFGLMTKDDKIKFALLKKMIPNDYKEIAGEMVDSCTDITGKDKCEKAFNFMKCMYQANPIAFIAP